MENTQKMYFVYCHLFVLNTLMTAVPTRLALRKKSSKLCKASFHICTFLYICMQHISVELAAPCPSKARSALDAVLSNQRSVLSRIQHVIKRSAPSHSPMGPRGAHSSVSSIIVHCITTRCGRQAGQTFTFRRVLYTNYRVQRQIAAIQQIVDLIS